MKEVAGDQWAGLSPAGADGAAGRRASSRPDLPRLEDASARKVVTPGGQ